MLINDCRQCPVLCQSRTRIVEADPVVGGLLVIGEAPGADEDWEGRGFVGRAGRTLHALLAQHGMKRGRDYGCANIVRCRPPGNRKPSADEIRNVRGRVRELPAEKASPALTVTPSSTHSHHLQPRRNQ
ncbi:uracil-DNA glycosylase family protein [Candidatus Igneacidithiobacillus taiwanensis]|uniref:uracil-DNA glycosylase family protein n=1 Tax=Candidatus Igneacidithiobacillus taiwanensis TaxID=1945924 RepID=UPI00289B8CE6|nr:uracil-DNA glycosylase family protein [Candidatus Igneacidithiobacillus taiwanensis]